MKKLILSCVFILLLNSAFTQPLYSSTASASRFNPGLGSLGTPVVAYDDVNIPTSFAAGIDSLSITKINVGIRRAPNAPATNVNLYYTTFENDSVSASSIAKTSQVFLGKVSLPVNGNSLTTSVISFGDSVTALFKIYANTNKINNGFQRVLIGASFDNPSPGNGIILTKDLRDHSDLIWIDNTDNNKSLYATNFSGRMPATYHLEIFGGGAGIQTREEGKQFADVAVNKMPQTGIAK